MESIHTNGSKIREQKKSSIFELCTRFLLLLCFTVLGDTMEIRAGDFHWFSKALADSLNRRLLNSIRGNGSLLCFLSLILVFSAFLYRVGPRTFVFFSQIYTDDAQRHFYWFVFYQPLAINRLKNRNFAGSINLLCMSWHGMVLAGNVPV